MTVNTYYIILLFSVVLGCKKPFSQQPKAALALPVQLSKTETSIAFITGQDTGENTYYSNAKRHFEAQNTPVITQLSSINEIITYLNQSQSKSYTYIHIVSHSNPWLGMALKTTKEGLRINTTSLLEALEQQDIAALTHGVNANTKIIFHSCGLAQNTQLLQSLKQAFATQTPPQLIASSYFNVFGGKYASHYLAKPYYGYYPTAESPGPRALAEAFKSNYPNTAIDWFTAIKTRQESSFGNVYSYTFNVPINWEFTFKTKQEIPQLKDKEAIMDWVVNLPEMAKTLHDLNIPISQYRWRQRTKGHTLYIQGKATVLCVLQPILEPNDPSEYKIISFDDKTLYNTL